MVRRQIRAAVKFCQKILRSRQAKTWLSFFPNDVMKWLRKRCKIYSVKYANNKPIAIVCTRTFNQLVSKRYMYVYVADFIQCKIPPGKSTKKSPSSGTYTLECRNGGSVAEFLERSVRGPRARNLRKKSMALGLLQKMVCEELRARRECIILRGQLGKKHIIFSHLSRGCELRTDQEMPTILLHHLLLLFFPLLFGTVPSLLLAVVYFSSTLWYR